VSEETDKRRMDELAVDAGVKESGNNERLNISMATNGKLRKQERARLR